MLQECKQVGFSWWRTHPQFWVSPYNVLLFWHLAFQLSLFNGPGNHKNDLVPSPSLFAAPLRYIGVEVDFGDDEFLAEPFFWCRVGFLSLGSGGFGTSTDELKVHK